MPIDQQYFVGMVRKTRFFFQADGKWVVNCARILTNSLGVEMLVGVGVRCLPQTSVVTPGPFTGVAVSGLP